MFPVTFEANAYKRRAYNETVSWDTLDSEGRFMFGKMLSTVRPSFAAVGFGMFLAINSVGLWGGVVSFLPDELQGRGLSSAFYFFHASAFALYCILWMAGAYRWNFLGRKYSVWLGVATYAGGWCVLAISGLASAGSWASLVSGALYIFGDSAMLLLWQRVFASKDADEGSRGLIVGGVYAAALYLLVYTVLDEAAPYAVMLVCLPVCCICLIREWFRIDARQPMFEDEPRRHAVAYKDMVRESARGAFGVGVMGFCSGVTRSLALGDATAAGIVNEVSAVCTLALLMALLSWWQGRSVRFSISTAYRLFFPFLATVLALVPFLGPTGLGVAAGSAHAFFGCATVVMAIAAARCSRDRGINPVFAYGFYCATVYTMRNAGIVTGVFAVENAGFGIGERAFCVIAAFYVIGISYFATHGGFSRTPRLRRESVDVELVALDAGHVRHRTRGGVVFVDDIDRKCDRARELYRLSMRETEVLALVARGNSVPGIAEKLFISENTVQTHMRHIYSKLGVHKKQEAIDLLEKAGR